MYVILCDLYVLKLKKPERRSMVLNAQEPTGTGEPEVAFEPRASRSPFESAGSEPKNKL